MSPFVKSFPQVMKDLLGSGSYVSFPELLMQVNRADCCRKFPPLQYMLQALPPSGFLRPLLMATTLDEIDRIGREYSLTTGFRIAYVEYLVNSFAYGLGLRKAEPAVPRLTEERCNGDANDRQTEANPTAEPSGSDTAEEPREEYGQISAWDSNWTQEQKIHFLTGLITVNRDNERRLGVKAVATACSFAGDYNFKLSAELHREVAGSTGGLFYAVYSREGVILETSLLGSLCYDDISPMPRMATARVEPSEVGKILLFWDE